jgi:hypothetical protein
MNFEKVEKKYRPIPFWSWNDKLEVEETRRQVNIMNDAGLGGFFMHARGGLLTEYMSEEWFDNVNAASEEANALGMYPWAYDENGWPSGFGAGVVNGLGEEYQQKTLHVEPLMPENESAPRTVLIKDGYRYYYDVNEFYVDVLDPRVIKVFIEKIYMEYKKRLGDKFTGFFTDEPQIYRVTSFPWSFTLPLEYRRAYGEELLDHLDELFFKKGNYTDTRVKLWKRFLIFSLNMRLATNWTPMIYQLSRCTQMCYRDLLERG